MHNLNDLYLGQGRNLFRPGQQDPAWLIRAAEHERILSAAKADLRNVGNGQRGIVQRFRVALSRD